MIKIVGEENDYNDKILEKVLSIRKDVIEYAKLKRMIDDFINKRKLSKLDNNVKKIKINEESKESEIKELTKKILEVKRKIVEYWFKIRKNFKEEIEVVRKKKGKKIRKRIKQQEKLIENEIRAELYDKIIKKANGKINKKKIRAIDFERLTEGKIAEIVKHFRENKEENNEEEIEKEGISKEIEIDRKEESKSESSKNEN
ncbi:hypothetical protein C1645_831450 [Glomus cerebriforme]|uniref:Uncharacterized protein n=1 Tax=Glomus cerebriforme TaxID=658196 RepID=A0A397S7B0_9GLOM|nr:hypothetical protein C1645_836261 [Glomus cerebriforme]RIA85035.1 hypothetical protein C1645_831450 [Glomus cerebriforme]